MNDKFEDFMKKNIPEAKGSLRTLELPRRKNWITGVAASGLLVASLSVILVNQHMKYEALIQAEEALDASFEDEFPQEYQDVDEFLDEI
jgi:hypothetical protein